MEPRRMTTLEAITAFNKLRDAVNEYLMKNNESFSEEERLIVINRLVDCEIKSGSNALARRHLYMVIEILIKNINTRHCQC